MPGLQRRSTRSGSPGPLDLEVRGAEKLAQVSRALRQSGDKQLKKDLTRALREAAKPMVADARQAAKERLPHRGGLADRVARSRITVRVRTSGRQVGVRIVANGPKDQGGVPVNIRALNAGKFRHPVYARGADREKWAWVEQDIRPGWFDEPLTRRGPRVRGALVIAIDDFTRKLGKDAAGG